MQTKQYAGSVSFLLCLQGYLHGPSGLPLGAAAAALLILTGSAVAAVQMSIRNRDRSWW